jgi:hypothetical protein
MLSRLAGPAVTAVPHTTFVPASTNHVTHGFTSRPSAFRQADSSERRNIEAVRRLRWEQSGRPETVGWWWRSRSGLFGWLRRG